MQVESDGFAHIDAGLILDRIAFPLLEGVGAYLAMPFVVAKSMVLVLGTICVRLGMPGSRSLTLLQDFRKKLEMCASATDMWH